MSRSASALRAGGTLLGTAAASLPLGAVALDAYAGRAIAVAFLAGAGLAALLAVASLLLAAWSYDKRESVFLSALLGGVLGRLVLFGAATALVAAATELPVAPFVGGLLSYYVVFQILEFRALHRLFGKRALPH